MHRHRQALLPQESVISSATTAQKSLDASTIEILVTSAAAAEAATTSASPTVMPSSASPEHYNSTAVMTPQLKRLDTPSTVGTSGASRYRATRDKIHDTVEELERIDAAAEANKKKYLKPLHDLKHSIDVEMKQRHENEIKDMLQRLKTKHRAEDVMEKEKYQAVNTEYRGQKEKLTKERELVLQRKRAEEQDAKHQRDSLSREDLLAYLDQDADEQRTRKRRKTKGVPTGDEDLSRLKVD